MWKNTRGNFLQNEIGNEAKTMCIESIHPQKIDSGEYSIIFEPYSVGELLAFVVASNFNLKIFSEKKSCFSKNMEEEIAINELNLTDDPHAKEGIGTKSFDDEGISTKKNNLIENGIFKDTFFEFIRKLQRKQKFIRKCIQRRITLGKKRRTNPIFQST